jgi:starch synthase
VYSVYNDGFKEPINSKFAKKAMMDANTKEDMKAYDKPTFVSLNKAAMQWADGVIKGSPKVDEELEKCMKQLNVPVLTYQSEESFVQKYSEFYDEVLLEEEVLAE